MHNGRLYLFYYLFDSKLRLTLEIAINESPVPI